MTMNWAISIRPRMVQGRRRLGLVRPHGVPGARLVCAVRVSCRLGSVAVVTVTRGRGRVRRGPALGRCGATW